MVHYRCGLRTCSDCAKVRAVRMSKKFEQIIACQSDRRGWRMKMITFTVPTRGDYEGAVKKINEAMVTIWETFLRRDGLGRPIKSKRKGVEVASGMISALEFGPKTGNVHVHCLYYGPWIDRDDLKNRWEKLTGAFIVDVRAAGKGAVREVCKYFTKVGTAAVKDLMNFEAVMKGKRRFKTYGVFYDPELEAMADDESMAGMPCPSCGERGEWVYEENFEAWLLRKFGKEET